MFKKIYKNIFYKGKGYLQQQVPLPLPCYDFAPVVRFKLNHTKKNKITKLLKILKKKNFRGVTGSVYKTRVQFTVTFLFTITGDSNCTFLSFKKWFELGTIFQDLRDLTIW